MSDPWGICPRCSKQVRLSTFRKEWTGQRVCRDCWDPKHPQMSVRGRADRIAVRNPLPEPADVFVNWDGEIVVPSDGLTADNAVLTADLTTYTADAA